jgi:hypothetical protein
VTEALKLFFSYSHQDEPLRDALAKHLRILEYQGLISSWHDRKILPGDVWDTQISINQDTADIILLLISADFIASRYCWDMEIRRAMSLHEAGKACVIPVVLRPVNWTIAPFAKLQALPKNAAPVESPAWFSRDQAFENITQGIQAVAQRLLDHRKQQRAEQQKEEAIAAYRQKFQAFATDSEISLGERFILKSLQNQYGLTDLEAQEIELAILNPAAKQQRLDSYRQLFLEAIAKYGYPFDEKARQDLKLVQNHLELTDTEVAQIEEAIVAQEEEQEQPITTQPYKYQPKHDPLALRNWLYCYQRIQEIAPELGMLEPKPPRTATGGWVLLKPESASPKGTWIMYKTNRGYVDLHVKGMAESDSVFENFQSHFNHVLESNMKIVKTGKSASVRLGVPIVNFRQEFTEQADAVKQAIDAAKTLHQWEVEHYTSIEALLILLRNQELENAYSSATEEADSMRDVAIADGLADEAW